MKELNEDLVNNILHILSFGLTSGLGVQKPGEMCVEAAICYAYGLPHSDNPPCIGETVRQYKIGLNDCTWPSNQTRAEGMKQLAIAQLGSNEINQEEFKKEIFLETQRVIIPIIFDWIPEEKRTPEHNELKKFCEENNDKEVLKEKFKNYYNNSHSLSHNYYNYNCFYYYYNCFYYYYYNYYSYNNCFYYNNLHTLLKLSADVAVTVLQKLNSPGCKFLHLIPS